MRVLLALLLLCVVPVSSGCQARLPTAIPQQQTAKQAFFTTYMAALEASNAIYEETFKAVGRAKAAGQVNEAQEAAWIKIGLVAQNSIEVARDALVVYLRASSEDWTAQIQVLEAIARMNQSIAGLTKAISGANNLSFGSVPFGRSRP